MFWNDIIDKDYIYIYTNAFDGVMSPLSETKIQLNSLHFNNLNGLNFSLLRLLNLINHMRFHL